MNLKLLKVLKRGLAVVLAVSLVMIVRTQIEYVRGAASYEEAAEAAELPQLTAIPAERMFLTEREETEEEESAVISDPNLLLMARMDLDVLRKQNSEVLGWISIPETELSYPLLQAGDNDYYLVYSWKKDSSKVGAIFIDYRSSADLSDFHTVIYGHRMRNGSMFASLKYFNDQEHWRTHPSVYVATFEGVYRYVIFSAYEASAPGPVYELDNVLDEDGQQAFIDLCAARSVIETGIVPEVGDQILTLSTCTGRGYETRWVVQGVLAEVLPVITTQ